MFFRVRFCATHLHNLPLGEIERRRVVRRGDHPRRVPEVTVVLRESRVGNSDDLTLPLKPGVPERPLAVAGCVAGLDDPLRSRVLKLHRTAGVEGAELGDGGGDVGGKGEEAGVGVSGGVGSDNGVVERVHVADVHVVGRGRGRVEGKVAEGVGARRFALIRSREGERVRVPASEASVSVSTG